MAHNALGYYLKKKLRQHCIGLCVISTEKAPTTTLDIIMHNDILQDKVPSPTLSIYCQF